MGKRSAVVELFLGGFLSFPANGSGFRRFSSERSYRSRARFVFVMPGAKGKSIKPKRWS
jgi:hypothetical protein